MSKVNEFKIHKIIWFFCFVYFLYSIGHTIYDVSHLKHKNWRQAENQSSVYSSRRSTTVTYNFVKDNVRISRKYPGIFEGLNTWMWGINKEDQKLDISFFIRKKDYIKIENNEIAYRKDIFGGKLNELEPIPFFGLRNINSVSNKVLLILDLWKYNYSILFAFILFILPSLIIIILKKSKIINIIENHDTPKESKIGGCIYIFLFILLCINLII